MVGQPTLHCSESYCDLHDYEIRASGICLRQDALRRSVRLDQPRSAPLEKELAEAFSRIADIWEDDRQPRRTSSPVPDKPRRRERRKGGTPL